MIADEQMLFSLELPQIPFCRAGIPVGKVADDVDGIVRLDTAVPEMNQGVIHLGDGTEGAVVKSYYVFVAEMQVGSVEYHECSPFELAVLCGGRAVGLFHEL